MHTYVKMYVIWTNKFTVTSVFKQDISNEVIAK